MIWGKKRNGRKAERIRPAFRKSRIPLSRVQADHGGRIRAETDNYKRASEALIDFSLALGFALGVALMQGFKG